jgi:5-formyltetrahydrofolate cyclo-ligase
VEAGSEPALTTAKRALRASVLARRAVLSAAELGLAGAAISERLSQLPAVRAARVVAAYVGVGVEIPTERVISSLVETGTTVLLPRLEADRSLTWRPMSSRSALVRGRHGLLEPPEADAPRPLADADVVVLPGLCYDISGNRLGRGGGSYDRALKDLPGSVTTIGIALDSDIVEAVPVDEHDQPVRIIVTPSRVITIDDGGS